MSHFVEAGSSLIAFRAPVAMAGTAVPHGCHFGAHGADGATPTPSWYARAPARHAFGAYFNFRPDTT